MLDRDIAYVVGPSIQIWSLKRSTYSQNQSEFELTEVGSRFSNLHEMWSGQLAVTIGILIAQLVNYGTQHVKPYGWRISLGIACEDCSRHFQYEVCHCLFYTHSEAVIGRFLAVRSLDGYHMLWGQSTSSTVIWSPIALVSVQLHRLSFFSSDRFSCQKRPIVWLNAAIWTRGEMFCSEFEEFR